MRKILDAVSIALLALQFIVTEMALYGANRLPDRFPTHYDVVGHADRWGTTSSLPVLPFVALVLFLFISIVAAFSSMGKRPEHATPDDPPSTTPENRPRVEELTLDLIAWIKTELVAIFACLQWTLIKAAWHPDQASSQLGVWLLLVAILITTALYIAAMVRAKDADDSALDSSGVSDNS